MSRRAATRRLIDYAAFDPRDVTHLLHEALVLQTLEEEDLVQIHQTKHALYTPTTAHKDPKVSSEFYNLACDELYAIGRLLQPYLNWPKGHAGKIDREELLSMQKEWEAMFGSLSDPAVAAKLKHYQNLAA